jgi:hypothetical protein
MGLEDLIFHLIFHLISSHCVGEQVKGFGERLGESTVTIWIAMPDDKMQVPGQTMQIHVDQPMHWNLPRPHKIQRPTAHRC